MTKKRSVLNGHDMLQALNNFKIKAQADNLKTGFNANEVGVHEFDDGSKISVSVVAWFEKKQ